MAVPSVSLSFGACISISTGKSLQAVNGDFGCLQRHSNI